jgi:hypothetical protein
MLWEQAVRAFHLARTFCIYCVRRKRCDLRRVEREAFVSDDRLLNHQTTDALLVVLLGFRGQFRHGAKWLFLSLYRRAENMQDIVTYANRSCVEQADPVCRRG